MKTEFNLSEKSIESFLIEGIVIPLEDVKEFIKRLKEEIRKGQYLFRDGCEMRLEREIDKLAGDDLI